MTEESQEYDEEDVAIITTTSNRPSCCDEDIITTKKTGYCCGAVAIRITHLILLCVSAFLLSLIITNGILEARHNNPTKSLSASEQPASEPTSLARSNDIVDNRPWPRLAWLLSFPNSGTSYTLELTRSVTNMTTASNYGLEYPDPETGNSVPLSQDFPDGPFLLDLEKFPNKPKGKMYVLTKTHCGGRCEACGPDDYIENMHSFHHRCKAGTKYVYNNATGKSDRRNVAIDSDRISRVVHLIRDPFDNAVSRFHLEKKKNRTETQDFSSSARKGFRTFCSQLVDHPFLGEEHAHKIWDEETYQLMKKIPCHGDIYRWAMWHNHAFALTVDMGVPSLVMHYENYATDFNRTVDTLMEFLHTEEIGEKPEFLSGKIYRNFYSADERHAVGLAVKRIATVATWKHVQHYFDEISDVQ